MIGEWPHPESSQIAIHYDVAKVDPKWADEARLKKFLYAQYEKKDQLLDGYYATGRFPGEGRPVVVPQSTMLISQVGDIIVTLLILPFQLFWIGLYYAHYLIWIRPLCLFLFGSFLSLFG